MQRFDLRILLGVGLTLLGGLLLLERLDFLRDETIWSYMWTLVPGFVGVGMFLSGLFSRDLRRARSGITLMLVSAVLFVLFVGFVGKLSLVATYGPAMLMAGVGVWLAGSRLFQSFGMQGQEK